MYFRNTAFKRVSVFFILSFTSFLVFSAESSWIKSRFINHVYLGLSVIKDTANYNFKRNEVSPAINFIDFDHFAWNGSGVGGEIYLGYDNLFLQHFYLGVEGFYDRSANSGNIYFLDTNTQYTRALNGKFKQKWQSGIVIRPGISIASTGILFARVGWIVSEISLGGSITQSGSVGSFSGQFSTNKKKEGIQLGAGMELKLVKGLRGRLEWDWNRLQSYSFNSHGKDSNKHSYATFRIAKHPILEQFKIGLNWRFG